MEPYRIGFNLINKAGEIVETFPFVGINEDRPPLTVRLPDSDIAVMSPKLKEELPGGYKVVDRMLDIGEPQPFCSYTEETAFDGEKVVVRRVYAETPDQVPETVTMAQCRLALLESDLLESVDAAVAASDNQRLNILWEYATDVRRSSPELNALGDGLGLSESQKDDLFRLAKSL